MDSSYLKYKNRWGSGKVARSAAQLARAAHSFCATVIRKLSTRQLRLIVVLFCLVFWLLVIGYFFF